MMNRKGMEVAIGTIVMIILGVLVFILALGILFDIFGGAEDIKSQIDLKTKSQIEAAMMRTNEIVSIPFNVKSAKLGSDVTFGVGVKNIHDSGDFSASLDFAGAYYPDGSEIFVDKDLVNLKWLGNFRFVPSFHLDKNEYKIIPLTVVLDPDVSQGAFQKGDYVFNACIFEGSDSFDCIIDNLAQTYTKKMYQVVVRVV